MKGRAIPLAITFVAMQAIIFTSSLLGLELFTFSGLPQQLLAGLAFTVVGYLTYMAMAIAYVAIGNFKSLGWIAMTAIGVLAAGSVMAVTTAIFPTVVHLGGFVKPLLMGLTITLSIWGVGIVFRWTRANIPLWSKR